MICKVLFIYCRPCTRPHQHRLKLITSGEDDPSGDQASWASCDRFGLFVNPFLSRPCAHPSHTVRSPRFDVRRLLYPLHSTSYPTNQSKKKQYQTIFLTITSQSILVRDHRKVRVGQVLNCLACKGYTPVSFCF